MSVGRLGWHGESWGTQGEEEGAGGVRRKSWSWGGPFLESLFWVQALHPGIGGPPYRDRLWVRVWPFPNFCPESWSF